ncbi:hypothetical protein C2857_005992 [Epichloe festucae Fl1]|uniref:Uncharacterized protein n=1 Tax=Epichloe festucae (strain Fl1) TaxID=877507 RepID=A0A7S9KT51_EPIFF|nr:hypothetical protein C2857_005992 [Epichloe festucae Fl1]
MCTEHTNRGAHPEPHADQDSAQSPEQDLSVCSTLTVSLKSADDATSSISSDKSDSKPPRSAMRRTSSISKIPQSPRRVRFDFMGEEVLPTSSPQQSAFIAARISSPEPAIHEADCTSNLATDPGEDEEEEAPPRKVSSSDALRALSRAPLDEDGTVWTVVNSDSEESATDGSPFAQSRQSENTDALPKSSAAATSPGIEPTSNTLKTKIRFKSAASNTAAHNVNNLEDDSTDDEDILSMAAKHKAPLSLAYRGSAVLSSLLSDKKVVSSQYSDHNAEPSNSERADMTESRHEVASQTFRTADERDDDMFHFEEDYLELPKRGLEKNPVEPEQEPEPEQSEEEFSDHEIRTAPVRPASLYATSPAVAIPRQMGHDDEEQSTPSRPKFQAGTVGSYKGRPLIMPVIRNPDLLAELHSSEPISPVVGSVHDRSPADDLKSSTAQASINQRLAASAPRSFSERLMIEDMMEAAKASTRTSRVRKS